jgi:sugar lactone lactonase YvrE
MTGRNGPTNLLVDIESEQSDTRMNDGKCDARGPLRTGSNSLNESPGVGSLYLVDIDMQVTEIAAGVSISNGLAFSLSGTETYYIDSPTRRIDVFTFPPEGSHSSRSAFADLSHVPDLPAGMTIDAEGRPWGAMWDGSAVVRVSPDGLVDRRIELRVPAPTSVLFGQRDYTTLFIKAASTRADATVGNEEAGSVLAVDVGIPGLQTAPFERQVPERERVGRPQ